MTQDRFAFPKLGRRHLAGAAALGLLARPALAQTAAASDAPRQLGGGVSYRQIGRWDVARLDRILTTDFPAFAGIPVSYTPARQAVRLYRVAYPSVVPERNSRPVTLSGLVAVPEDSAATLPLLSYQHGTVYLKQQVPSFPEQSPETQVMLAQFAGQGYALVGADYVGMGESTEPQGYMVKASHQQATADLLPAARAVLADLGKTPQGLCIAGWSQGGYVTMAMLERLEKTGIAVRGAATASAPVDPWAALGGFMNFPRPNDATWVTTLFILLGFSYETYYGVPGLAQSLIKPQYLDVARRAWQGEAVDAAQIPTAIRDLVQDSYFDPAFYTESVFGRLLFANQAYRWIIRTPVHNHYGENDEVIRQELGRLAMTYQRAIGNDRVQAISTGDTTHRGTFARAVPQWKQWFDSLPAA
jgi:dienelactone hydrolase